MAKRRVNGEGSIRKRKEGRWEGRCTAGRDPVTGKEIYKNVLGKTQAEVKEKRKAVIEKSGSLVTVAECYTVGQWLDTWMENYARSAPRPTRDLPGGYGKPHQACPRGHSSGKADGDGPSMAVQAPAGKWPGGMH